MIKHVLLRIAVCLIAVQTTQASSAEVRLAVASNFIPTMRVIAEKFEQNSDHRLLISAGSSGKFVAQIVQGARYDLFFSADQQKVKVLSEKGLTVKDSQWTYAIGTLALWSNRDMFFKDVKAVKRLEEGDFNKLAIANPKLAPYGLAAVETLQSMDIFDKLESKLVTGENVSQAFQFVATKNADIGFVALSQLLHHGQGNHHSTWLVPKELYSPIKQDAVLLKHAEKSEAANEFLAYMHSNTVIEQIRSFGYDTITVDTDQSEPSKSETNP